MRTLFLLSLAAALTAAGSWAETTVTTSADFATAWNNSATGESIVLNAELIDLSRTLLTANGGVNLKAGDSGACTLLASPQLELTGTSTVKGVTFSNSAAGAESVLTVSDATFSGVTLSGTGTERAAVVVNADGRLVVNGNSSFINNSSDGSAAAIEVGSNATLSLNATEGQDIEFSGNLTTGYNPLDIYLGSGAAMNLTADAGSMISFAGGVASASGATISKTGAGTVELGDGTDYAGSLSISEGKAVLKGTAWSGSSVTVGANGSLVLQTGAQVRTAAVTSDGTLEICGHSTLGVIGESCTITLSGDLVFSNGATLTTLGTLTFAGDTSLTVSGYDVVDGSSARYLLIDTDGYEGDLSNISSTIKGERSYAYTLELEDGDIYLNVESSGRSLSWMNAKKTAWEVNSATTLWNSAEGPVAYEDGDFVSFTDGTVSIVGEVAPGEVTLAPAKSLTFKTSYNKKTAVWSGAITGESSVTIEASTPKGKVTMNDGNTYSGGTVIKAGTVNAKGVTSFGTGDITLTGGTLNLASKAVANDIELSGAAAIKGGKKYLGTYTQIGGELMKGSVLNVVESATISGGVVNGTLSGLGMVKIDGDVALGTTGKITTSGLKINGDLSVSSKGLGMNSKTSAIEVNGGSLTSAGKLSAYSLTMTGGELTLSNPKPMSVSLKGDFMASSGAVIDTYGALSAASLDLQGVQFTVDMADEFVTDKNTPKAQSISLKDKYANNRISNSVVNIGGKMSVAGNLVIDGVSQLHLFDPSGKNKGQSLTVKGSLNFGGVSSLRLNGALSAKDLTLGSGSLTVSNAKPVSVSLKGDFMASSGAVIDTYGAFSAASLDLQGVQFTVDMADEFVTDKNTPKAQSISLKDKYAENRISNSVVNIGGKMSVAGNLVIDGVSQLHLFDPSGKNKGQSLAVKGSLNFGGGSSLRLNGALSAKDLTLGSGSLTLCGAKLSTIKVSNSLTLNGGTTLNLGFNVTEKDKGKAFNIFTFKTIAPSITDAALNELLGLGTDAATLAFDTKRKAITLTVTDAAAWNAYAESVRTVKLVVAASEDDELVESAGAQVLVAPAAVDPLLGKVADTLVQSTWGTAGASRAFADTIAARGTHATALADGKGAAWISAMGGSSRISADGAHAGADYTLTGAAFGMEANLGDSSTIGLAIGNSWGKVSTFSAYPVDADSTHQGIYGKHILGSSTTLSWMAAHTRTESDANLAGMASDWTQDALQLDARVDKLFAISDRTTVSAFVGMQYLATDKGECNGLSTGSLQNLRGEIGVSAGHKATDRTYVYGELSFIGDMVRHNPTATVGDYRSRGANPGRAGLNLSVGASYQLNDSWSLNGSYSLELMQNQTSHSANVGAIYSF